MSWEKTIYCYTWLAVSYITVRLLLPASAYNTNRPPSCHCWPPSQFFLLKPSSSRHFWLSCKTAATVNLVSRQKNLRLVHNDALCKRDVWTENKQERLLLQQPFCHQLHICCVLLTWFTVLVTYQFSRLQFCPWAYSSRKFIITHFSGLAEKQP